MPILTELVRVDLERVWEAGRRPRAADYLAEFPALAADTEARTCVAFEEYRQRLAHGESPDPEDHRAEYGVEMAG